ncbi:MAG: hypothetical protein ISS34_04730 [Candidatus Omnitrophica bacterium]|nr:hypothetical protein [Candidatus Omnitrophota bacterium]
MKKVYNFSDFTEKNYKKILNLAKSNNYRFISYKEADRAKDKYIILRHDVDFSPHRALALAEIENNMGIRATYCVQLGSFFYNIFEREVKDTFLKIKKLKHSIGLHFDSSLYNIKPFKKLEDYILYEKDIVEKRLGTKIDIFSFHNPLKKELNIVNFRIAGLINVYNGFFMNKMKYISDSNGYWRYRRLSDLLKDRRYDKMHILIHPGWWQRSAVSPWERIVRCVEGRRRSTYKSYNKLLGDFGRENIGYD